MAEAIQELMDVRCLNKKLEVVLITTSLIYLIHQIVLHICAHVKSDYRFVISGNYISFYRVCENEVYVDHIVYSRRDYIRILFGEIPKQ